MKDKRFLVGCIIGIMGGKLMTPWTWTGTALFMAIYIVTRLVTERLVDS